MVSLLMVLHVFICFLLVISVLLQAGKGGGLSGSFGGGGQALFGGRGAATFFSKATVVLGALFFVSSLALAMMSTQVTQRRSLVQEAAKRAAPEPTSSPTGTNRPAATPATPGQSTPTGTVSMPLTKPASSKPQGK
jgi:preprotein translocase subunit SecG